MYINSLIELTISFLHNRVADELRETLTQCGISHLQLGTTYIANRLSANGSEITSAIDHIYVTDVSDFVRGINI